MKRHEWRVLPVLRALPESVGEQTFLWAHIPLLALLLWGSFGQPDDLVRVGIASFAVLHVLLHIGFRKHEHYEFNTLSSWLLVGLTGLLGAIYLFVLFGDW